MPLLLIHYICKPMLISGRGKHFSNKLELNNKEYICTRYGYNEGWYQIEVLENNNCKIIRQIITGEYYPADNNRFVELKVYHQ